MHGTWRSRRSTRSGPTGRASVAGSICRRAPQSTRRARTPGSFRRARACGRNSRSTARSRRASSSGAPTAAWRFATYVWNEAGHRRDACACRGIAALPAHGARVAATPYRRGFDCRACHESAAVPVLGFSALQLSSDRDPLAPHARCSARTSICDGSSSRGLDQQSRPAGARPPRIAASSPIERAALGYLHGNCGHCHNDTARAVPVDLRLRRASRPRRRARLRSTDRGSQPFSRPRTGEERADRLESPDRVCSSRA